MPAPKPDPVALPTEAQLEAAANRRMNKFNDTPLARKLTLMKRRLATHLETGKPASPKLIASATLLFEQAGEAVSCCKKGCSYCCNIATSISLDEAKKIANHLKVGLAPEVNAVHFKDLKRGFAESQRDKYTGKPCPLLGKDGLCTVYSVRPSACRLNVNISDWPQLCDTSTGLHTIPYADNRIFWAVKQRSETSPQADIREFFSHIQHGKVVQHE